jgi:hypothetical protein
MRGEFDVWDIAVLRLLRLLIHLKHVWWIYRLECLVIIAFYAA